ncbi:MAG: CsiV family protein [Legionella sp.]|nr:CsiV family protein [Legionella sp.]
MSRLLILTLSVLYASFIWAKPAYQIDLIVFAHKNNISMSHEDITAPLLPVSKNAIPLLTNSGKSSKPYHLLPTSQSQLRDEYYQLSRKSGYQVLGHYSWLQNASSQSIVALPTTSRNGWQIQGTVQVRQSNYYLIDADLQCTTPANNEFSINVKQKQRIKGNLVNYLDHPQIGILVKVHKIVTS